jgi:hypothetical protein
LLCPIANAQWDDILVHIFVLIDGDQIVIPSEALCKTSLTIRNELDDVYPLAIMVKQFIRFSIINSLLRI